MTANFSVAVAVSSMTVVSFKGVDLSGTNGSGAIGATGRVAMWVLRRRLSRRLVTTRWFSELATIGTQAVARTVGTNQSLVHQYLPGFDTFWVQRQNQRFPLSGTTVSIDDSARLIRDQFNLSIVEIRPIVPTFTLSGTQSAELEGTELR